MFRLRCHPHHALRTLLCSPPQSTQGSWWWVRQRLRTLRTMEPSRSRTRFRKKTTHLPWQNPGPVTRHTARWTRPPLVLSQQPGTRRLAPSLQTSLAIVALSEASRMRGSGRSLLRARLLPMRTTGSPGLCKIRPIQWTTASKTPRMTHDHKKWSCI